MGVKYEGARLCVEVAVGEGSLLPDRGPPLRAQIVHESERTRVVRHFSSGRTVICKELLGPDAQRRLQHEVEILQQVSGVGGVAQVLDEPRYRGVDSVGRRG